MISMSHSINQKTDHRKEDHPLFASLPRTAVEFKDWPWSQIKPYFQELNNRPLDAASLASWMVDWSNLEKLLEEAYSRLYVNQTLDTTDPQAEQAFNRFLDEVRPVTRAASQQLKEKLLASGLTPPGFEVAMRNLRAEAALFREDNLPLLSEEKKLAAEYEKVMGTQTVVWEGQELTLPQLLPVYQDPDREKREHAWRLAADRQLADREAINDLWCRFMQVRGQLAANTGLPDYRAYRWTELHRFDYTPEDCFQFHAAIEEVVVPAARELYEKRRKRLGAASLRPWDLEVDPLNRPALRPFKTIDELVEKSDTILRKIDPQLAAFFEIMRQENLLDLSSRKGKAPGAYCTAFVAAGRSFIFMNAVGIHDDVMTLVHEGGHGFNNFESNPLLYHHFEAPLEFAEVASMSMEYLSGPYLAAEQGGFYSAEEAARARVEHLDAALRFWPYMAVVDSFQHWVYTHHKAASKPANCDEKWAEVWDRYMPGVDWSGLEEEKNTGWQRKPHIHSDPFYYVEYGLAQLGAMQVWRNALQDQSRAVAAYRRALALGGSATIPDLYSAAGVKFTFDTSTLGEMVDLAMRTIEDLEAGS
jgi:oligoendopeptidase F